MHFEILFFKGRKHNSEIFGNILNNYQTSRYDSRYETTIQNKHIQNKLQKV